MTPTTAAPIPELPPMSRAHVLAVGAVAPTVPGRLLKTLMCLAVLADHRTGLVRPVGRQHDKDGWNIATSTWHDHIKELEKLGRVRQVTLGNKEAGRAAEYLLLLEHAPSVSADPAHRIPSVGEGVYQICENTPSPSAGADPVSRIHPELSAAEQAQWQQLSAALVRLTEQDRSRLNADLKTFDQAIPLARTLVRLDALGHRHELVAALTEHVGAGADVFTGAMHPARALWKRTRQVADRHGVHMFDATPAVPAAATNQDVTPEDGLSSLTGIPQVAAMLDSLTAGGPGGS